MRTAVLPSDKPLKVWAAYGDGRACDGCNVPISPTEIEHELELPGALTLRFHPVCENYWRAITAK